MMLRGKRVANGPRSAPIPILVACLALLAVTPAQAGGLDCAAARAAAPPPASDGRPMQPVLDELAEIYGFGLFSGWSFAVLDGQLGVAPPADSSPGDPLLGQWWTRALNPDTGTARGDGFGSLEISDSLGQGWLEWRIELSEPCEGITRLPLVDARAPVLRVNAAAVRDMAQGGFFSGAAAMTHRGPETLDAHWEVAEEILSSITLSRTGTLCRIGYRTPEGSVGFKFLCEQ